MSALAATFLTLADWAKRLDPDGKVPDIVELLAQTNEMLTDMLWTMCNNGTSHRTTVRTGLPAVAWRLINGGVPTSKSTTAQVDEATGMLESYSEVDKALADLNGNTPEFRLSEASAYVESMSQEMQQTVIYGNSSSAPEEFTGLSARYSSLSAGNAQNVVDCGGSGSDNTSIWLIVWGQKGVHGIFPKGSKAGLSHEDLGQVTLETTNGVAGSRSQIYRDHWKWDAGLALLDWRQCVRIANIDISANSADIIEAMIRATHRVFSLNMGKAAFYMNRTMFERLDLQSRRDVQSGGGLKFDNVEGKIMSSHRGIPVRRCDQLLETETAVT